MTQTSAAERAALAAFARGRRCLAEIGVFQGVGARLLTAAMDPGGIYFAVDPYPGGRLGVDFNWLIARREVARNPPRRVVWIRSRGADAPADPRLHGHRFDFVFIDGDHTYRGLRGDWTAWRPLIGEGGIVALHDTRGGRLSSAAEGLRVQPPARHARGAVRLPALSRRGDFAGRCFRGRRGGGYADDLAPHRRGADVNAYRAGAMPATTRLRARRYLPPIRARRYDSGRAAA